MKTIILTASGAIRILPDSALGRDRQPWFLPDFGREWQASLADAVRIGRLGKGVSKKFAARYFDAITLMWIPVSPALTQAVSDMMDGAVVPGQWQEIAPGSDLEPFEQLLADVTQYCTVKTGDILAIERPYQTPITLGNKIEASLNGNKVLHFNVR